MPIEALALLLWLLTLLFTVGLPLALACYIVDRVWARGLRERLAFAEEVIHNAFAPLQPGPPKGLTCSAERGGPDDTQGCQGCQCEWQIAVNSLGAYIERYTPGDLGPNGAYHRYGEKLRGS